MLYLKKKKPGATGDRATMLVMAACMTGMTVGSVSAIFAAPAHAASSQMVQKKKVRYGDLNLASQNGRAVLDQRIRRAAKQVCTTPGTLEILEKRKFRVCSETAYNRAWATAQQRIDKVRLAVNSTN